MQAQQHNSSYSIVPKAKTADLMFTNIFSSIMAVKKQVTSTLQTIKQWKLYFSFLMVFTEREFFNRFRPYSGGRRGEVQKDSLLVSLNAFDF